MVDGRQSAEWGRFASLMCLLAEQKRNRKRKVSPYTPDDFMPPALKDKREPQGEITSISQLAAMMPGSTYTPHEQKTEG